MNDLHASQIADLLNARNQLVGNHSAQMIMEKRDSYVYLLEGDIVIACVEVKKVQWYQYEILHVSVNELFEGKGLGSEVYQLAELKAIKAGAKILQCTIRSNNERSIRLFESKGYKHTSTFYNADTNNVVNVYQKSVSIKTDNQYELI